MSTSHQIGRALHEYHEVQGHLPAPALADRDGKPLLSWRVAILPQLGYQSLYERFHLDEPWDSPHNLALLREMPKEFACPGGPGRRAGQTGYLVVVGPKTEVGSVNTPFEPTRGADFSEFFDGTSNTALVIETDALVPWTKPEDLRWTPGGPLPRLASPHAGGAHVLFADGSARFLKSSIAPTSPSGPPHHQRRRGGQQWLIMPSSAGRVPARGSPPRRKVADSAAVGHLTHDP